MTPWRMYAIVMVVLVPARSQRMGTSSRVLTLTADMTVSRLAAATNETPECTAIGMMYTMMIA